MSIVTKQVDYLDPQDAENLIRLLGEYAELEDTDQVPDLSALPRQLAEYPTAFSILAYPDAKQRTAIGLVNCFFGFSTFLGRALVNVHDVIVTQSHRGRGISGVMLDHVEKIARENDCCRLTLEVYADNSSALRSYKKQGFTRDPAHPEVDIFFLRKSLLTEA